MKKWYSPQCHMKWFMRHRYWHLPPQNPRRSDKRSLGAHSPCLRKMMPEWNRYYTARDLGLQLRPKSISFNIRILLLLDISISGIAHNRRYSRIHPFGQYYVRVKIWACMHTIRLPSQLRDNANTQVLACLQSLKWKRGGRKFLM